MKHLLLTTIAAVLHDIRHMKKLPLKIIIIKIIIVIACVVGFAFVAAFIGGVAYHLHLTGSHQYSWMGGVEEVFYGLCIGAIIGGVAGYKIIKPKSADLLRKHGGKTAEEVSIHVAAKKGNIEAIKQHIANGADVNEKDDSEWTPLHYAASYGRKEIIELLIDNGADVNAKKKNGATPLHEAAAFDHKETAELLIAEGADVNAKDMYGETPLHFAIIYNKTNIADLLRKHGGKTGEELKAEGK